MQLIQKKLGTEPFQMWFEGQFQLYCGPAAASFYVTAQTAFVLEWYRRNYASLLTQIAREINPDFTGEVQICTQEEILALRGGLKGTQTSPSEEIHETETFASAESRLEKSLGKRLGKCFGKTGERSGFSEFSREQELSQRGNSGKTVFERTFSEALSAGECEISPSGRAAEKIPYPKKDLKKRSRKSQAILQDVRQTNIPEMFAFLTGSVEESPSRNGLGTAGRADAGKAVSGKAGRLADAEKVSRKTGSGESGKAGRQADAGKVSRKNSAEVRASEIGKTGGDSIRNAGGSSAGKTGVSRFGKVGADETFSLELPVKSTQGRRGTDRSKAETAVKMAMENLREAEFVSAEASEFRAVQREAEVKSAGDSMADFLNLMDQMFQNGTIQRFTPAKPQSASVKSGKTASKKRLPKSGILNESQSEFQSEFQSESQSEFQSEFQDELQMESQSEFQNGFEVGISELENDSSEGMVSDSDRFFDDADLSAKESVKVSRKRGNSFDVSERSEGKSSAVPKSAGGAGSQKLQQLMANVLKLSSEEEEQGSSPESFEADGSAAVSGSFGSRQNEAFPVQALREAPSISGREPVRKGRFSTGTFDSFVVGLSNRVAYSTARGIHLNPGLISPILFTGSTGVGKTHLLDAIYRNALTYGFTAVYRSCEEFMNDFVASLRDPRKKNEFLATYRQCDILLLDNLQFLLGKQGTLTELQNIFNHRLRHGRQIILASDHTLEELEGLGPELCSKLRGGCACHLNKPSFDVSLGILAQESEIRNLTLSDEQRRRLAEQYSNDVRSLLGALNTLEMMVRAQFTLPGHSRNVSARQRNSVVEQVVDGLLSKPGRTISLDEIKRSVAVQFGIDVQLLSSGMRIRKVSQPRMLAMWLARKFTRKPLSEIGQAFGCASHSTVISAQKKVDQWRGQELQLQTVSSMQNVNELLHLLESQLQSSL